MKDELQGVEVTITYKAFASVLRDGYEVTSVVVDWAGGAGLDDSQVCEAVFHATNTYSGKLWELIKPHLSPRRTHTALSVGDEVHVNGITYRCEPVGWEAVAVDISAHDALLDALASQD